PTTPIRPGSSPDPSKLRRTAFESWSATSTPDAAAASTAKSLRAGTQRLFALNFCLAVDAIGDVGEGFQARLRNRPAATPANAVLTVIHAPERGVHLRQNILKVLTDGHDPLGLSHARAVLSKMVPHAAVFIILFDANRPHLGRHVGNVLLDLGFAR